MKNNKLIIISAPSGSGKTTIVRQILKEIPNLEFSISACSRYPRKGEINGTDYHFFSIDEFKNKIDNNEFIEWEEVYTDQYYGTLKSEVYRIWDKGNHVIFDVDVVGGVNIKKQFPDNSLAIFIEAPSIELLEKRLRKRGTETEEQIKKRINKAEQELKFAAKFDKIIINDNLDLAIEETKDVINEFLNL
ncbi:MAG: guanylate kinase [Bacteroidetes bacterium]|nr:MAG: guanylate kinase [Bacteroidota bacterium]